MSRPGRRSTDAKTSTSSTIVERRRRSSGKSASPASTTRLRDRSEQRPSSTVVGTAVRPLSQSRTRSAPLVPKRGIHDTDVRLKSDKRRSSQPKDLFRDSIAEDPFFRRYNTPDTQWIAKQLKAQLAAAETDSSILLAKQGENGGNRSVPQLPSESTPADFPASSSELQAVDVGVPQMSVIAPMSESSTVEPRRGISEIGDINIGIFGIGKSDFVEKALDLDAKETSKPRQKSIVVQGDTYNVRLLELSFNDLCDLSDQSAHDASEKNQSDLPRIDGVVALYDAMDVASLDQVSDVIDTLQEAALPAVLASPVHDDAPPITKAGNSFIEMKAKSVLRDVNLMQTSESSPDSQKNCVSVLLQDIVSTDDDRKFEPSRPRANSSTFLFASPRPSVDERRERALSEFSGATLKSSASHGDLASFGVANMPERIIPQDPPQTPDNPDSDFTFFYEDSPIIERPISALPGKLQFHQSHVTDATAAQYASTFEELVERLRIPPIDKLQVKFVSTFLAFYRFFAAPFTLLDSLVDQFTAANISQREQETIVCLTTLERWISAYPGDFAHAMTKTRLQRFLADVQQFPGLGSVTERVGLALDSVVENDDTAWAHADDGLERPGTSRTFFSTSSDDHGEKIDSGASTPREIGQKADSVTASVDAKLIFGGNSISVLNALGPSKGAIDSASSSQTSIDVAEPAQRQARLLSPARTIPLTKIQWRLFMAQPDDEIARELTRMDWIMFSSIRPRDMIRHVTVAQNDVHRFRDLENVNRMIGHFNHIAFWVNNMVLLRDKPKHRAQLLEKLMRVARKVRELNNYNALGALVAGIQGNAVHRLAQTRALVSPEVQKDFMKLEILVSTQKGHFAYRLAWDNTSTERVPFLPLHRRDLVSAEAGNKTFIPHDEDSSPKINWRKFEIMGDILLNIQKAQATSYTGFVANDVVKALVLDCKISKDEDVLYHRSVAVEPPGGIESGSMKRKLTWVAKYYGFSQRDVGGVVGRGELLAGFQPKLLMERS